MARIKTIALMGNAGMLVRGARRGGVGRVERVKRVVLLTGKPGSGKTTAIQRIIALLGERAGGFFSREVRTNGERRGFEIVTLAGEVAWLAIRGGEVRPPAEVGFMNYRVNLEAIELVAVPAILEAVAEQKVVVIDEIGPMEILSPLFRETVRAILDSDARVVGTIVERPEPFADEMKGHPRVRVVTLTPENRERLPLEVYESMCPENASKMDATGTQGGDHE
jgi:nucleoside-triphosphatase